MIYFVTARAVGRVKIGTSTSMKSRLHSLRNACPVDIVFERCAAGGRPAEQALHRMFKSYRCKGEWFHLSDEIETYMEGLLKPRPNGFCYDEPADDVADNKIIEFHRRGESEESISQMLFITKHRIRNTIARIEDGLPPLRKRKALMADYQEASA